MTEVPASEGGCTVQHWQSGAEHPTKPTEGRGSHLEGMRADTVHVLEHVIVKSPRGWRLGQPADVAHLHRSFAISSHVPRRSKALH